MAKKGEHRITVALDCGICGNRNYISQRNKMNTAEKLKLKKFCRHCKKITEHKEQQKLK